MANPNFSFHSPQRSLLARAVGVLVGRPLGGLLTTTLLATISDILFFFLPFLPILLSCVLFSYKECTNQKSYSAKVYGSTQKPQGKYLSRTHCPFWGPLATILNFLGSAVLQAVSYCPAQLCCYFHNCYSTLSMREY